MKKIIIMGILLIATSCNNKIKVKKYNKNIDVEGIDKYLKYAGENYNFKYLELPISEEEKKKGIEYAKRWDFKLKKPIVRSGSNYFYRFSLNVVKYKDFATNDHYFSANKKRCKPNDNKGNNLIKISAGQYVVWLSSDCLMNRILDRHFDKLVEFILETPPESGSIIHYSCGGNCSIK
ncbi:hypothetical protein KKF34_14085 [Myxococcota bacterium]|nr:hypothetical protein [Myxococcota bacterium]MBU1379641.1 hypothetical protein [Myxococcota bacterium]MBU1498002.1 hypothetical protein [Myxococcota bacterium]